MSRGSTELTTTFGSFPANRPKHSKLSMIQMSVLGNEA